MKSKKYFIKVYGCQMSVSDAEKVAGWYQQRGWQRAGLIEEADEIIIVTCSVRQTAEDRVYGLVNNIVKRKARNKKKQKIILTGCMMRYSLKWLKDKLPQVDEFKKIGEFELDNREKIVRESKTYALVPIMEGCNQFCTYCVVPYARGREVSRPFKEIICEIKRLSKRNYREIILLGQNVNAYGKDLKARDNFARLLEEIHKIKGIKKISFLTSNPWDLNDEIIKAISLPKIDRYLHLPVQSGDDEILRKMNRPYTVKEYFSLVEKIRKKIPDIKIGTDIIVGFPGETEKQFENTVDLCKKIGFTKAYVAMYSPRWGTTAFRLKDNVLHEEKKKRWKILDDLINQTAK